MPYYIKVTTIDNPMVLKENSYIMGWSNNVFIFNMYRNKIYKMYENKTEYDIVCGKCKYIELKKSLNVGFYDIDLYELVLIGNYDYSRFAITQRKNIDISYDETLFIPAKLYNKLQTLNYLSSFMYDKSKIMELSNVNIGMIDKTTYLIYHHQDTCFELM